MCFLDLYVGLLLSSFGKVIGTGILLRAENDIHAQYV